MKYSKFTLLILSFSFVASQACAEQWFFGFIPKSFPRDTIDFDLFREEMAIGQIIEPLITSDQFGNINPCVSDRWEMLEKGTLIRFHIRKGLLFSNGTVLTASDVSDTLKRHWQNPKSESNSLLKNILAITETSGENVDILLKRPQIAIFKILSREHLGIMPKNWQFAASAAEPYIGTGPYRLVMKGGKWHYLKNDRYRELEKVKFDDWELVYSPDDLTKIGSMSTLPDYAPALTYKEVAPLKLNPNFNEKKYTIESKYSFAQLSAWWNPHSTSYTNTSQRKLKMGAIRLLFSKRMVHLPASPALGVIPIGVSGHLISPVEFPSLLQKGGGKRAESSKKAITIKVAIPNRLREEVFEKADVADTEKSLNVRFEVSERSDHNEILKNNIDVIIDKWAVGVNDPEEIVEILVEIAHMKLAQYLGDLYPVYMSASTALDWTKRSEIFRELDKTLVMRELVVPGWRTNFFTLIKNDLSDKSENFRYTPSILYLKMKKDDEVK